MFAGKKYDYALIYKIFAKIKVFFIDNINDYVDGFPILQRALMDGDYFFAEELIRSGANVNAIGDRDNTAISGLIYGLWIAYEHGKLSEKDFKRLNVVIKKFFILLRERGADLFYKNNRGVDIFSLSIIYGVEIIFKELIEAGVDINIKSDCGWTPLVYAVRNGRQNMIEELLVMSNIELRDAFGNMFYEHIQDQPRRSYLEAMVLDIRVLPSKNVSGLVKI